MGGREAADDTTGALYPARDVEVACLDRRGVIVSVNEAWRRFCSANNGDLEACGPGVSYLAVCDLDPAAAPVAEALRAQLAGRLLVPAVFSVPCDGPTSARWFDVHLSPRLDDAGAVEGAVVALTPVSHPVPGPSAEPIVTDLIEYAPDGALLVDADGIIRYANRQFVTLSGYSSGGLIGQPVEMFVGDAHRSRHRGWREGYQAAPRDRAMGSGLTLALLRHDGTELPVEISLAPLVTGGVPMTFATVRDVREIRAQDHARRRLLHMLDLDPDAVYVVDGDTTRIRYASSGATALLGYTRDELLTMNITDLTPHFDDSRRLGALEEYERAGSRRVHHTVVARRAKDGTEIPCDARAQLVDDPEGGRQFVIVDRDARPRLATELDRQRQLRLSQLVSEVTQLVLSDAPSGELYLRVVAGAASLLDAGNASLVVYDPVTDLIDTLAAFGPVAKARARSGVFLDRALVLPWMRATSPILLPTGPPVELPEGQPRKGPGVVAQFRGTEERLGLLTVFREPGQEPFTRAESAMLADLASQVALVVEIGRARITSQRLEIVEERQRIARDLHDMVIQDLIGIGMQLADSAPDDLLEAGATHELVTQLDDTIRRLRLVVFDARTTAFHGSASEEIRRTVREAARTLDHRPELTLDEAVDTLPGDVVSHLLSVLREGLSNVARHAGASSTRVLVAVADSTVSVCIEDDGCGLGDRTLHGTGTASMRERAEMVSGTLSLTDRADGGAQLLWTASVLG